MLKLVEDLGVQPIGTRGHKARKGLYWCSNCKLVHSMFTGTVNQGSRFCSSCALKLAHTTHGGGYSKLYSVWGDMKRRCLNPNADSYQSYGGAGVTVHKEWIDSFEAFRDFALSNGYKEGLEIDKDYLSIKLGISPHIYSPETVMFVSSLQNSSFRKLNGKSGQELVDLLDELDPNKRIIDNEY